jgi:hypothetical protein
MLKRICAAVALAVIVWVTVAMLGCDVGGPPVRIEQDVEVYVPGHPPGEGSPGGYPPGEEDEEDEAQTLFEE